MRSSCSWLTDFCTDKNVDGWPSIFLYKNGAYVEKFKGSRDLSRLKDFATNHAEPSHASVEVAKPTTLQGTAQTTIQPTPVVTTRVQPPLHVQTPRAGANLDGAVRTLDEENFQVAVEQGPVFVKFYAPWYCFVPFGFKSTERGSAGAVTAKN
jgi:thioredoxin domain-containing protein 5